MKAPKNRMDVAKASAAKRKASAIDAGQKGRTTATPKTTADMYDRRISEVKKEGNYMTAGAIGFTKKSQGLSKANPSGPQRVAKLTPKKKVK